MSRLIDADKLPIKHGVDVGANYGGLRAIVFKKDIDNAPTVEAVPVAELPYTVWLTHDVVQVVRCKDCKWYYIFNGHDRCDLLDLEARDIKPDWFCADGKRRE